MVRNCITNMPKDIKQQVIDHANIADADSNKVALGDEMFTFIHQQSPGGLYSA